MGSTWKQMSVMKAKGTSKLRVTGTDDARGAIVGSKFGIVGMDNGGCSKPKETRID